MKKNNYLILYRLVNKQGEYIRNLFLEELPVSEQINVYAGEVLGVFTYNKVVARRWLLYYATAFARALCIDGSNEVIAECYRNGTELIMNYRISLCHGVFKASKVPIRAGDVLPF